MATMILIEETLNRLMPAGHRPSVAGNGQQ